MHICHVITRLIIGGAQENTLLTCEGLHARGHEVTLISGPTRGPEGSLAERARTGGYRYIEIPELVRPVNPWLDARALRELEMRYRELRPDVVHTHSSKAGILGRFATRRADIPAVVHTIHGMSFNRTQPWWTQRLYASLERRAARYTDRIVTVADAMTAQSVAARVAPPRMFTTVYSGMDVARFTPSADRRAAARRSWGYRPDEDVVVVGTVARLFARKGYEELLPAMSAAAAAEPRLRFVWVGDGAQRELYEGDLAHRGLADRTVLTGLVTPEEVADQIAGFDILAHTSQWEGLPRVVVQAALMQVPAVAFDIDGTPEVVRDGVTGRLVRLNDTDAFVSAVVDLATNEHQRGVLGAAARRRCLEQFDHRRMVAQLEQLYRSLLT